MQTLDQEIAALEADLSWLNGATDMDGSRFEPQIGTETEQQIALLQTLRGLLDLGKPPAVAFERETFLFCECGRFYDPAYYAPESEFDPDL